MTVQLSAAARVLGASTPREALVSGWSVDSRTLAPGDLFFALCGPQHDGHDFAAAALEKGAEAIVLERALPEVPAERALRVEDSLASLQRLAAWGRRQWGGRVIAVTGSAGKTTTKDAIAHVLGTALPVGKTSGNLNNHVGLPLSILRLPDESRAAVLEMGMNHSGEIRALARIAQPEIGVVTNVGYAHVESFRSIDEVALAKRELVEELPRDGVAILNADDPRVLAFREVHPGRAVTFGFSAAADLRADPVRLGAAGACFRAGGVEFSSPLAGRHSVLNLLAALAVARVFEIPLASLRDAVASFAPARMRGERLEHAGLTIWNDCYNSNPEAARSMLDVLAATPARRRIAVLGEMLELGHAAEPLHREVGRYAVERGIDVLIGIRGAARHMVEEAVCAGLSDGAAYFFEDPTEAGAFARQIARPGDALLLKGSRGVRVERALESLVA
jgi:UDP-N-acetylmuramoyl-tripeptide--D-alanyl-D-alanine ligase